MKKTKLQWTLIPTELGTCGITWSLKGVHHFFLPEEQLEKLQDKLQRLTGSRRPSKAKNPIQSIVTKVQKHFSGRPQDFSSVALNLETAPFAKKVYEAARKIPAGKIVSYADIAIQIGSPRAMRAVGTALGKNPIPLLIPCHRVVAAQKKMGGFSAPGGVETKRRMLLLEGVILEKPVVVSTPAQLKKAIHTLSKQDPKLRAVIQRCGTVAFKPELTEKPLNTLVSSIVHQQLGPKAANTILKRVHELILKDGNVCADAILATPETQLRAAGLSNMKVSFLKDLAKKYREGKIPPLRQLQKMSNSEIIEVFTQIKGIGRWTVEMFLIFDLGRADVFPVLDYGVRRGLSQLHQIPEVVPAKDAEKYGEVWRPYRSIASLYLWRSLDQ